MGDSDVRLGLSRTWMGCRMTRSQPLPEGHDANLFQHPYDQICLEFDLIPSLCIDNCITSVSGKALLRDQAPNCWCQILDRTVV